MATLALLALLVSGSTFHAKATAVWNTALCGKSHTEVGYVLYKDGTTSPLIVTEDTPSHGEIVFPNSPDAVAFVHSHPNNLQDRPSTGDIASAKRSGKFVYVISRSGLWQVSPSGEVSQLEDGTKWLGK